MSGHGYFHEPKVRENAANSCNKVYLCICSATHHKRAMKKQNQEIEVNMRFLTTCSLELHVIGVDLVVAVHGHTVAV